ncbi:MAG: class I SAM-dependent methyltransferase [Novipirellula sp. JB048]
MDNQNANARKIPLAAKRIPDAKELSHERLGEKFRSGLSDYDTNRRVEVLVDQFLSDPMVVGKRTIDVGCGYGFFSKRLVERGARVVACDLGPNLLAHAREFANCEAVLADALNLSAVFEPGSFDLVVSSECIEHTPDPALAIAEMARLLAPGGHIALSTPNLVWSPVVRAASLAKLRPFDGYENFSTWRSITTAMQDNQIKVLRKQGLHLFPFQFGLHALSRWCDDHLQIARGVMINLCVLGVKT